ncbi:hypothetical protein POTOM_052796 [Populus tomentosa]|uniref:Uncharacterized protein n=1 Tax=Populus tomentosa TaxID=118781 RepID=A0A8X7Y744_POPTO|nr:hypothetical protein POTOM_052796 [Populus tomentosa]
MWCCEECISVPSYHEYQINARTVLLSSKDAFRSAFPCMNDTIEQLEFFESVLFRGSQGKPPTGRAGTQFRLLYIGKDECLCHT